MNLVSRLRCSVRLPERGHHFFGKYVLGLDALPVLHSAEIGDNRQFSNAALSLECLDLTDYLYYKPFV